MISKATVSAKLPVAWDTKANKVVSEKSDIEVTHVDSLEDVLEHYGSEEKAVEAINSLLQTQEVQREYQSRLAAYKPSDLSLEDRIQRFVNSAVRTGLFTADEARRMAEEKAARGELN